MKLVNRYMNRKSIRFQIIFWYSLTLFTITWLIFSGFFLITRQSLYQHVDQELVSHAIRLTDIATSNVTDLHDVILRSDLLKEFSEIPGMMVVILDQNGNIVLSSLGSDDGATYTKLFDQVRKSDKPLYVNLTAKSIPMRFVADPVLSRNNVFAGTILVAQPLTIIQNSLDSVLSTLYIVFAILILPIILAGYLLARKIFKPIVAISNKMELVTSEHLNERIENPQTGDELEKLATSFNHLLDRLQAGFTRERQFIGDVAHELKTPISTLRGEVELTLSKPRTTKEYQSAFREALTDINRLSTLIKNILDLAWLNTDTAQLGKQEVNLTNIVNELLDIALKLAAQKNINMKSDIQFGIIVAGSEDKLSRAILNLIDNAIKYTPDRKSVNISLKANKSNAVLEIADTGIGIPEKDLSHVFERFYRGSKVVKTLGSGLGLAITQGIIKSHNGQISISSKVGKGTDVLVSLPLVRISA